MQYTLWTTIIKIIKNLYSQKNRNRFTLGRGYQAPSVAVVAPRCTEAIESLAREQRIRLHLRGYEPDEAAHYFLVIAATNDAQLHERISSDAQRAQRLVNVLDNPALCPFFAGSVVRRGKLTVAVSTEGAFRRHLMAREPDSGKRRKAIETILQSEAVDRFLRGDERPLRDRTIRYKHMNMFNRNLARNNFKLVFHGYHPKYSSGPHSNIALEYLFAIFRNPDQMYL